MHTTGYAPYSFFSPTTSLCGWLLLQSAFLLNLGSWMHPVPAEPPVEGSTVWKLPDTLPSLHPLPALRLVSQSALPPHLLWIVPHLLEHNDSTPPTQLLAAVSVSTSHGTQINTGAV